MKYKEFLEKYQTQAVERGLEESAILLLLLHESKLSSAELYLKMNDQIEQNVIDSFEEDVKKYFNDNVPIQYIIGTSCFYGDDFNVNENVLIPRYETEELVENVLFLYDDYFKPNDVDVVDIGTGSGCISCTLALEEPHMHVCATDISFEALGVARENALKLDAKVDFYQGNMLEPVMDKKFDILVSNPPYIPASENVDPLVKDNEPNIALFGGDDGLKFYHIILSNAPKIMKDKCILGFEHGYNKTQEIEAICKEYFPDAKIYTKKDLQGLDRMTFVIRGFNNEK